MLGFTAFDFIVLIALLCSVAAGFAKGFTTEALKLVAWAAAIFITIVGLPLVAPITHDLIPVDVIANFAGPVLLFAVSLYLLSFLAKFLGERIRTSFIGPIDRGLGALFGLGRGILVVCGVYLVIASIIPDRAHPDWVSEARLYHPVRAGAVLLADLTPNLFDRAVTLVDQGYDEEEREQMDELIEDVSPGADEDDAGK